MSAAVPRLCARCQVARSAWERPRVDFCYACLPGGPFTPPPCRQCGSADYFCQGLCEACHPRGPFYPGSCTDCLAYGTFRVGGRRCWTCRWWHQHYPEGPCPYCGRTVPLGRAGACRLCNEQVRIRRARGEPADLAEATRHGQQLFIANIEIPLRKPAVTVPAVSLQTWPPPRYGTPVRMRQDPLFHITAVMDIRRPAGPSRDGELVRTCEPVLREHASRHGWSRKQVNDVRRSLSLLQAL
jgi:hypothetical protein